MEKDCANPGDLEVRVFRNPAWGQESKGRISFAKNKHGQVVKKSELRVAA
jgi:hypothetical protein